MTLRNVFPKREFTRRDSILFPPRRTSRRMPDTINLKRRRRRRRRVQVRFITNDVTTRPLRTSVRSLCRFLLCVVCALRRPEERRTRVYDFVDENTFKCTSLFLKTNKQKNSMQIVPRNFNRFFSNGNDVVFIFYVFITQRDLHINETRVCIISSGYDVIDDDCDDGINNRGEKNNEEETNQLLRTNVYLFVLRENETCLARVDLRQSLHKLYADGEENTRFRLFFFFSYVD